LFKKAYILLIVFVFFGISTINAQYFGGIGSGYDTAKVTPTTCAYTMDYSLLFYAGGNGAGYDTAQISKTTCLFTVNSEYFIYAGGNGSGYDTAQISKTTCPVVVNPELFIYVGGNGAGYDTTQISKTSCPAPEFSNFYLGSAITVGSSLGILTKTSTNQSGPYILAAANNYTIVKGDCVSLTTTGSGATSYVWSQSVGSDLTTTNVQNTTAKPTQYTEYTVTATGSAAGCRNTSTVAVTVIDNGSTTISYPTSVCNTQSTNQYQYPVLTGLTNGTYSISPSTGMTIDAKTGAIKTYNATVQNYTITYTYGSTCSSVTTASVTITNNCASNAGVVSYTNMYVGGLSNAVVSSNYTTTAACAENPIIETKIFAGGLSNNVGSVSYLNAQSCPANIDIKTLIYAGGLSNNVVSNNSLQLQACTFPVGDNFYLGGTGMGYNLASKIPTSGAVAGTTVAVSADQTICPGAPITLTATGATNFTWSPATNLSSTIIANPVANPMNTTTYTVVGTGGVGCINTAKVTVTVLVDNYTQVSYGAYNFDETDMGVKKVNYIVGPLTGSFSASPAGLFYDQTAGSFTPGLSTSGPYVINYNYTKGSCNYTYVSNINITTLPPSITYPSPSIFYINYSGITATPTNIGGRAIAYEALDALPTGLTINATTGVISGTPSALVENASVRVRAYNLNKSGGINNSDVYTMSISVRKPIINSTTTSIPSMNTTYGLASTTNAINVSGQYIIQNILLTPPNGFEISNNSSSGFANTLTLTPSSGTVASANAYIRLKSTAGVGNFTGTVVLTSDAADNVSLPIATSYVAAGPLTVTATYFQKFYGSKITLTSGSTSFSATGLVNGEKIGSVTLSATSGTAANDVPGLYNVTPSAAVDGTFSSANYNITYVPAQFEVLYSLYNFQMTGNASNWVIGKVPLPKITSMLVSNITYGSASVSATIASSFTNISRRGVCWSTTINPTTSSNNLDDSNPTTGSFSLNISGLTPLTTYYARAYIVIGNTIYYSNNFKFATPKQPLNSISLTNSSQYLSFPRATSMIAAGNFTFETWIKFNTIGAVTMDPIFGGGQGDYFSIYGGAISARIDVNNPCSGDRNFASSSLISLNNWHHMAMVRVGTTITTYLDGSAVGTTDCAGAFLNSGGVATIMIGKNSWRSGNLNASITNMRLVVGTAIYTGNFTPPSTKLTSVSGTQLLLNFDDSINPYKDSSPNNVTITAFGSPVFNIAGGPF
jgi:hypothetical protein